MEIAGLHVRVKSFFQEFLPEKNGQLLFPLGSFLLLIGTWTPWLPPHHTLYDPQWQAPNPTLWFDPFSPVPRLGYYISLLLTGAAFFASTVLWSLPVPNTHGRFRRWVFLPTGLGVAVFSALVLIAGNPRVSVVQPASQVVDEMIRRFPSRLASLGTGFYLTLLGAAILAGAVWRDRSGRSLLPFKFRSRALITVQPVEKQRAGRDVLVLLIAVNVVGSLISLFFLLWAKTLTWSGGKFPTSEWWLATGYAGVAAICAVIVLGRNRKQSLTALLLPFSRSEAGLGVGIALVVIYLPRLVIGIAQQFDWNSVGIEYGFSYSWPELLLPDPFFWLLLGYVAAILQETVLRGFLQTKLAQVVSLGQTIFLVGVLWELLPLHYGIRTGLGVRFTVPGIPALLAIAILIAYSVPLGWLFARSGRVVPVALMHGTFTLFHQGRSESIYLNHPSLYWLELVALVFTGWFLFHRYPITQASEIQGLQEAEAD